MIELPLASPPAFAPQQGSDQRARRGVALRRARRPHTAASHSAVLHFQPLGERHGRLQARHAASGATLPRLGTVQPPPMVRGRRRAVSGSFFRIARGAVIITTITGEAEWPWTRRSWG